MSKSNALENELLDLVLGGQAWTIPANVWVGLYTTSPGDAGGGVEVVGGSYARVMVANDLTTWEAAVSGVKANAIAIDFPQATADWGTVKAWAVHRHATNDDVLYWGTVLPNRIILNGAEPSFMPGALVVNED